MKKEEALQILKEHKQDHVLKYYDTLNEKEQKELLSQIKDVDWEVVETTKSEENQNRGEITPLGAVEIKEIEERKEEFIEEGLKSIREGKVGAILLAGGMGTRLGFDQPKGTYPIGINRDLSIFECLINNLLEVTDMAQAYVPLYVMTSEKNHEATVQFFEDKNYFGYPEDYVHFFIQDMAPAVDYEGKLLLEEKGRLATSPNGNGGWFTSLHKSGLLDDVHNRGVEWLNIFAVDNVLQRIADPAFIGATILSGKESGSKVVRKAAPEERVGVLCAEDGRPSIVEYYEMTDEMANLRDDDGELTYRFGVILNYLFRVDRLEDIMANHMHVHVVEKKIPYIDETGNLVKPEEPNGYKFETLILDMINMMESNLPYEVVREKEFAPVKNLHGVDSVDSARELLKANGVEL
ncbi:MAG: UDPGP type 1 family protein [Lachnospiraceae bacterium]|nr:UDPGP type 1 family protein [Lachnospiraceae bacterium]